MKVQVRFRFNKQTGNVEEFIIDDYGSNLSNDEHNLQHDRIANEIGQVLLQYPRILEMNNLDITPQTDTDNEGQTEEKTSTQAPNRQQQKS